MGCKSSDVVSLGEMTRRQKILQNRVAIISDELEPRTDSTIRECEFLAGIALEIAGRAMRNANPPSAYHASGILRTEGKKNYEWLMALRNVVVGKGHLPDLIERLVPNSMENRQTLIPGNELISSIADVWEKIYQLQLKAVISSKRALNLSERQGTEISSSSPLITATKVPSELLSLARQLSRRKPSGAISSSWFMGNFVHAILQGHYRLEHPSNCLMTENRFWGPCATSAGTLAPSAYQGANVDASIWAFSLYQLDKKKFQKAKKKGKTKKAGFKRPDLVDLSTREVWEIKSRLELVKGLTELWDLYIDPANDTIKAWNRLPWHTPLEAYRPGKSWKPYPFYFLGGTKVAWVHSEIHGIWYYDIIDLRLIPIRKPRKVLELNPIVGILGTLATIVLIIDPLPGDEVLIAPLLSWLGAAAR